MTITMSKEKYPEKKCSTCGRLFQSAEETDLCISCREAVVNERE